MTMRFGVFDHIEPVPGQRLDQIYRERLLQIERLDAAGFYAYHLAEHHTPAVHSLAPSQNVFLGAVAQRTRRLRFGPCVYVLPLHHPLRLIEEISMLDHLSDGRLEIGVGRGGVMEAYFWGQEADSETQLRALSRDAGHHSRRAEPRSPHLRGPLPQLRAAADVPAAAAEALSAALVHAQSGDGGDGGHAHDHRRLARRPGRRRAALPGGVGRAPGRGRADGAGRRADDRPRRSPGGRRHERGGAGPPPGRRGRSTAGTWRRPRRLEAEKRGLTQFMSDQGRLVRLRRRSPRRAAHARDASGHRRRARALRSAEAGAASQPPGRRGAGRHARPPCASTWTSTSPPAPTTSSARSSGATSATRRRCAPSSCSPPR